jgi:hypothetical protein
VASRRDLGGLGGEIVASGRDSSRARGGIEGFGRAGAFVGCVTCLLAYILRSNSCNAFLFQHRSRQVVQVEKTLLLRLAEACKRKEEIGSFLIH